LSVFIRHTYTYARSSEKFQRDRRYTWRHSCPTRKTSPAGRLGGSAYWLWVRLYRLILVPSIHHLSPTSHCLGILASPPPRSHHNMSDQPGLSHFQVLFESALQDYERKTGITLTNHPLAERLQTCHSAESVTALLQEQTRALGEFRESDKIMRSLKNVVSVLSKISATAALGKDFGTVCLRPLIGCSTDLNA
jgi:hypothetical protein